MNIIHKKFKTDSLDGQWIITIGNFDGYHLGHQRLVHQVMADKKECNCKGGLLTFEPHPKKVLQTQIPFRHIYDFDAKCSFLKQSGLDACFVIPFTKSFAKLSSIEFLEKLFSFINLEKIIVGYDFNFGKGREGSANLMREEAHKRGIDFLRMEPVQLDGITVSSTMIRRLLFEGEFKQVERFLGRPWSINGVVREGRKLGHTLGFPTMNLEPDILLPLRKGVYTCIAGVGDEMINGVCNIGINPTFDGEILKVETHLFGFNRQTYGENVKIFPQSFLRDETKFSSVEELKIQIQKDIDRARAYFQENNLSG